MRIEITFAGDSHDAVVSSEEVTKAVRRLFVQAEETAQAVQEIKVSQAQAAESTLALRRIAQGVEQIGQEARKSRHEVEQLKLATAGTGGGFGGLLPGGARPRTAAIGLLGLLGAAGSGPAGAAAAAVGVGAAGLIGPAIASVGVLVAAFHGLGDAIGGDRQAFEKLDGQTQQFVQTVRSLIPWLHELQGIARQGVLPGVDKALHDLLSPQNAAAIQRATGGIAGATGRGIAGVGQTVFGSPDFQRFLNNIGTHGARDVELMADAAAHLAHGMIVLLNAGQPVADWLAKVVDEGARFVDTWLKGKDATGELSAALAHGRDEFELVARLVAALAEAVFSLARDLEPLGNQIIADLTRALQGLHEWLDKNRQAVADFTLGALHALEDTLKTVWPIAVDLAKALKRIVDAMGGWETAFKIVIAGAVVKGILDITKAVYGLRAALLVANPELAALVIAAGLLAAFVASGGTTKYQQDVPGHPGRRVTYEHGQWYVQGRTASRGGGATTRKAITVVEAAAMLGTTPEALAAKVPQPASVTAPAGGQMQLPTSFRATHDTRGADWVGRTPGPDAVDLMAKPGTKLLAPEDGQLTRISGHDPASAPPQGQGGPWGRSFYYIGVSGTVYFGTHLSDVAPIGSYKKGDVIAIIGNYPGSNADHVHWAIVGSDKAAVAEAHFASTQPSTLARGGADTRPATTTPHDTAGPGTDPFGTAPPFTADKGANILPAGLRLAMARAGTTPGARDDRTALRNAISWLKANVGGFTGEDQINAYLELASLLGQLKALAPKVAKHRKPALASEAARISAHGEAAGLIGLLTGDPFAASLEKPQSLGDAQKHLAAVRHSLLPEIRAIDKEIREKTLTAQTLAVLRAQMGQYKKTISSAVDDVKAAIERQRTSFEAAWRQMGESMIAGLEQKRAGYKSPSRLLLDQLVATHDTQALNDALDQANQHLADALKGHQQDAQQQLDQIRQYIGTSFLVNAIDATQSAILGGDTVQISGEAILAKMHDLLTAGGNVVDPEEVKSAQKEVEDAKYQIHIAGLQKNADAEEKAYNDQIDAQEQLIRDMEENWAAYFAKLGGDIDKAKQTWIDFFKSIGLTPGGVGPNDSGGSSFFQGFPPGTTFDNLGIPHAPESGGGPTGDLFFQGFPPGTWFDDLGIPHAPGFEVGGPVPHDMLAQVHGGEYVVPAGGTLVKGGGGDSGGQQFNVILEGDLAALGDFVTVKAVEAHDQIGRRIGLSADRRRRSGRY